ncbi:DNA-formamidopyrimidine glycosylase family protein [Arachidicoccus sp.]|uniref:DNA-formamidopyrimidine glycosylase family protein n=1 Tax=Arachidicoccus sp. TaxID=1872624 RepID=UPI003D1C4E25
MPEGPSILILKELVQPFCGKKILEVTGNTKQSKERLLNCTVRSFKSWGKQFLICFDDFTVRIHLLLFGSYLINETKAAQPRLSLHFENGLINFYACSVKFLEDPLDSIYDWEADILSQHWNPLAAKVKLLKTPSLLVCDALLTQDIFAGSGNIIKNEVLFRERLHPLNKIEDLNVVQLESLIDATRSYAFDFLKWKKNFELKKHWQAHNRTICPRCNIAFKRAYLGKFKRRTFYCSNCQILYNEQ